MNYMSSIADCETAVECRLEKSCERNGWIASAHLSFAADYVDKLTVLRRDSENILNTIAPYHLVPNVKVPFAVRKVA